jgi:hypothetical protein
VIGFRRDRLPETRDSLDRFLERITWIGFISIIAIVGGIFFGPWVIDKDSVELLLLISNPTTGAFSARMTRAKDKGE